MRSVELPERRPANQQCSFSGIPAFGQQDVTATALQMALVAAGIGNHGVIMTPHVMSQIRDSQGNVESVYTPKSWLTATTPGTASLVTSLMQAVVTNGTATTVGFPASWNVAAKTGTAETGPNATLTNDWMIAFAPANNPKVAVAVVVPNQPGNDHRCSGVRASDEDNLGRCAGRVAVIRLIA